MCWRIGRYARRSGLVLAETLGLAGTDLMYYLAMRAAIRSRNKCFWNTQEWPNRALGRNGLHDRFSPGPRSHTETDGEAAMNRNPKAGVSKPVGYKTQPTASVSPANQFASACLLTVHLVQLSAGHRRDRTSYNPKRRTRICLASYLAFWGRFCGRFCGRR